MRTPDGAAAALVAGGMQAFAEAGADVLFIDALESREEMEKFCNLGGVAAGKPKASQPCRPEDLSFQGTWNSGFRYCHLDSSAIPYPVSLLHNPRTSVFSRQSLMLSTFGAAQPVVGSRWQTCWRVAARLPSSLPRTWRTWASPLSPIR